MTPKEKAQKLVKKYYEDDLMWDDLTYIQAKQCALIAVDEILNTIQENTINKTLHPIHIYYSEVKQEIEKL